VLWYSALRLALGMEKLMRGMAGGVIALELMMLLEGVLRAGEIH